MRRYHSRSPWHTSPVRSGLGTVIPGALGFAAPAALPLPAGAAAGSCSCPPGFPSPPGHRLPAASPLIPVPHSPLPERLRTQTTRPWPRSRAGPSGAEGEAAPPGAGGGNTARERPARTPAPGRAPPLPAQGRARSAWFPKRLRLTSASRSPRPLPAQGARSCQGGLTQEPEPTSCRASPRPVTGCCPRRPRVGAGQGSGRRSHRVRSRMAPSSSAPRKCGSLSSRLRLSGSASSVWLQETPQAASVLLPTSTALSCLSMT